MTEEEAKRNVIAGSEFLYDSGRTGQIPDDWSYRAARGVLYDLLDRRGIKHELYGIDHLTRCEIVDSLAAIIKSAKDAKP